MARPTGKLDLLERIAIARATDAQRDSGRADRARTIEGLTSKQAELLNALIAFGDTEQGLSARDIESYLARISAQAGIVGWAASDCTIALNRLLKRGLVQRHTVKEGNLRHRWHATPQGEATFQAWLDATSPEWRDEQAWARKLEAQRRYHSAE